MNRITGQLDKMRGTWGGLVEYGLAAGVKINTEGLALKFDGVDASGNPLVNIASEATDKIIGFSYLENPSTWYIPVIGEMGRVVGGKYTTAHFPILMNATPTSSVSAKKVEDGSAVTVSAVKANGEVTVTGVTDGDAIRVTYTYIPDLASALATFGEDFSRHTFDEFTNIVATPKGDCQIFTLSYDAQETLEIGDTMVAGEVNGIKGMLKKGDTPDGGMKITVTKVPTAIDRFLGISFDAGF